MKYEQTHTNSLFLYIHTNIYEVQHRNYGIRNNTSSICTFVPVKQALRQLDDET